MGMRRRTGCRGVVFSALCLGLAVLLGCCGRAPTPGPAATAVLVDMDGVRHGLPQAEASYLAGIVAAVPDTDTPDHIALDPPYRVILDGLDLALGSDELTLMHRDGTRTWNAPGVRSRLLKAVGK